MGSTSEYIEKRAAKEDEPLFITRYGTRLQTLDVYRICQRLLKQALAFLPEGEKFAFTPHQLRHTFLKKVTDKHGVHFAQELSGNISIKDRTYDKLPISSLKMYFGSVIY